MKKALLSFALLLSGMMMTLMSCDKELTLEERIAEEENQLTDEEKSLLHQTPAYGFEGEDFSQMRQEVWDAYTNETVYGWHITKDGQGFVTCVEFDDITQKQPPVDGKAFFAKFFSEEVAAKFVRVYYDYRPSNYEDYVLYCGDLVVSSFIFEYDAQGIMRRAQGGYYPIDGLNPNPNISSYLARMILASYLGKSVKEIHEKVPLSFVLIPQATHFVPTLVYHPQGKNVHGPGVGDWVAWVDAHTGRLLTVSFGSI